MNELFILLNLLRHALINRHDISCLEPLFVDCKPYLSQIFSISHCFCENCCDLYTPCHVSEFVLANPELYDLEIGFFNDLTEKFKNYIRIDIRPYTKEEYFKFKRISIVDREEKLKQLYTIVSDYA